MLSSCSYKLNFQGLLLKEYCGSSAINNPSCEIIQDSAPLLHSIAWSLSFTTSCPFCSPGSKLWLIAHSERYVCQMQLICLMTSCIYHVYSRVSERLQLIECLSLPSSILAFGMCPSEREGRKLSGVKQKLQMCNQTACSFTVELYWASLG